MQRLSTGLFYDLLGHTDKRVRQVAGRAIELYVGRVVSDLWQTGRLLPEQRLPGGGVTCEWILDEPTATVVIECKRITLLRDSKTTGDREAIRRDFANDHGVGKGVSQLMRTVEAVRQGHINGIDRSKRIVPLLVTLDELYFGNNPYIRALLDEVVRETWNVSITVPYQICSVAEFEGLCRMLTATGERLSDALVRKMDTADHAAWDLTNWVAAEWPGSVEVASLSSHVAVGSRFEALLQELRKPDASTPT